MIKILPICTKTRSFSDAYNVEVSDAGWPSTNFTLTTGATSATWDVLPAYGTR